MSEADNLKKQLADAFKNLPTPVSFNDLTSTAQTVLADNLLELSQFLDWLDSHSTLLLKQLNG